MQPRPIQTPDNPPAGSTISGINTRPSGRPARLPDTEVPLETPQIARPSEAQAGEHQTRRDDGAREPGADAAHTALRCASMNSFWERPVSRLNAVLNPLADS